MEWLMIGMNIFYDIALRTEFNGCNGYRWL